MIRAVTALLPLAAAITAGAALHWHLEYRTRKARRKAREDYLAAQEKTYLPWLESEFAARKGQP